MKKTLSVLLFAAAFASCKQDHVQPGSYAVNETTSKVEWKGSAVDHFHIGSFDVKGSFDATTTGTVIKGNFTIPIASIEDFDLQDPIKTVLLDDLKSANFFNLPIFPEATFVFTKTELYKGGDSTAIAGATVKITGNFTMIGKTLPVSFAAKVTKEDTGLFVEGTFNLDRTKWGMDIYSDPNEQLFIYPDVNIHLKIHGTKK